MLIFENEYIFTIVAYIHIVLTYFAISLFFIVVDMDMNNCGFVKKQDVYLTTYETKEILVVAFRRLVIESPLILGIVFLGIYIGDIGFEKDISLFIFIRTLIVNYILSDCYFYVGHRLLHTKYLYEKVHKMHHRFYAPIAAESVYCTTVEMIFVNIMTILFPCVIQGVNIYILYLWFLISIVYTTLVHCGYYISHMELISHDKHHQFIICNYGISGLCDRIFNTKLN